MDNGIWATCIDSTGRYGAVAPSNTMTSDGHGVLFVSNDYGSTYSTVTMTGTIFCVDLSASSDFSYVYVTCCSSVAAGQCTKSQVFKSQDKGVSWAALPWSSNPSNANFLPVTVSSSTTGQNLVSGVALSNAFQHVPMNLYTSTDYGMTWTAITSTSTDKYAYAQYTHACVDSTGIVG